MQHEHLKILLDNNDFVIWMIDKDFALLEFNQAFYQWYNTVYGTPPVLFENILKFTTEAEHSKWEDRYKKVFQNQQIRNFADSYTIGDTRYDISINLFPVVENGIVTKLTAFSRSIYTQIEDERVLRETEDQFKQLVEQSDAIFWILNNKDILYVSPGFDHIFGRPRSFIYQNPSDLISWVHPQDKLMVVEALKSDNYTKRGFFNNDFRIIMPDGSTKWINARTFPMYSQEGFSKVLGIAEEITQKKEIELTNKALSAQFQSVLESTSDMVFAIDRNYLYTAFNEKHKDYMFNTYDCHISIGGNILEYISERKNIQNIKEEFDRALVGEQLNMERAYGKSRKSKRSYAEVSLNPTRDIKGEISGISVFVRDVTRRRLAETRMKRNQQLLTSINRNINEAIFRSTAKKGMIYVNQAFVEMFGFTDKEEASSTPSNKLYNDPERREVLVKKMMDNGYIENEEVVFKRKDGSLYIGLVSSTITVDDDGLIFFDGAIRDITSLKHAQDELAKSNSELKKSNQQLDRFVYTASHDLKAPLASISGLISIYKQEKDETQKNAYIDMIENSVNKLGGFIREIVDYSRNTRLDLKPETIQIETFIKEIVDDLSHINTKSVLVPEVQVSGASYTITDRMRLENILKNLISNAINYSDSGKSQAIVKVEASIDTNGSVIKISDNGIGIAKENLPKVFDMFFRASADGDGSGLGLYIVAEAVEMLNGTIEVESEVNKGTSFIVKIPHLSMNLS